MNKKLLTPEQQNMIDQVAASMAIENMPLTQECYDNMQSVLTGEKTEEQIAQEIIRRCTHV